MYRLLFRTVCAARNSSLGELNVLPAKCEKAAVFRIANGGGVKAISTSSASLCEKKDNVPSNHDEKTNAGEKVNPAESPTLTTQKAEDDSKVVNMAEQREGSEVLTTDNGSNVQQQMNVKQKKVNTDATKSAKRTLLDYLGDMRVDVTSKRKLKLTKKKQYYESASKTKFELNSIFQKATEKASSQSDTLDPELVAAASAAASTMPNQSESKSELLRQLRQQEGITEAQKKGHVNTLGQIFADIKVSKNRSRQSTWTSSQIQYDEDGQGYTAEMDGVQKKGLKDKRLNIFTSTTDKDQVEPAVARPTIWDLDFAHQLSMAVNKMPRNSFEEMIEWTKEGKMWQYPINNEAGLEEEANVPFNEHIFLEQHLKEGFPRQGPVRHFMELVVAGLSKNPYLTVQQKKDHISWFRDYFRQKEDVLKEADVYLN